MHMWPYTWKELHPLPQKDIPLNFQVYVHVANQHEKYCSL